jgi:hypothetical protein
MVQKRFEVFPSIFFSLNLLHIDIFIVSHFRTIISYAVRIVALLNFRNFACSLFGIITILHFRVTVMSVRITHTQKL